MTYDQQPPPPPPPPGDQYPPQYGQPPASRGGGCGRAALIALAAVGAVVVLLIVVAVIAVGGSDDDDNGDTATDTTAAPGAPSGAAGEPDEVDDVTLDSCDAQPGVGWAVARGTIANDSPETATYFIEVNVLDSAGTVVGNALSSMANVPANGNASWEAPSTVEMPEGGSCQITSVERVAS
jgi:hypothetical protein